MIGKKNQEPCNFYQVYINGSRERQGVSANDGNVEEYLASRVPQNEKVPTNRPGETIDSCTYETCSIRFCKGVTGKEAPVVFTIEHNYFHGHHR